METDGLWVPSLHAGIKYPLVSVFVFLALFICLPSFLFLLVGVLAVLCLVRCLFLGCSLFLLFRLALSTGLACVNVELTHGSVLQRRTGTRPCLMSPKPLLGALGVFCFSCARWAWSHQPAAAPARLCHDRGSALLSNVACTEGCWGSTLLAGPRLDARRLSLRMGGLPGFLVLVSSRQTTNSYDSIMHVMSFLVGSKVTPTASHQWGGWPTAKYRTLRRSSGAEAAGGSL